MCFTNLALMDVACCLILYGTNFQDTTLSGTSVTPTSEVSLATMLVLLVPEGGIGSSGIMSL